MFLNLKCVISSTNTVGFPDSRRTEFKKLNILAARDSAASSSLSAENGGFVAMTIATPLRRRGRGNGRCVAFRMQVLLIQIMESISCDFWSRESVEE